MLFKGTRLPILFIRHAHPEIIANLEPRFWPLSLEGKRQSMSIARSINSCSRILCSTETKSQMTTTPLAQKLGIEIETSPDFDEIALGTFFPEKKRFIEIRHRQLSDFNYRFSSSETINEAISRFSRSIPSTDEPIVICTHGTILTAYLTRGWEVEERIQFWNGLDFGQILRYDGTFSSAS